MTHVNSDKITHYTRQQGSISDPPTFEPNSCPDPQYHYSGGHLIIYILKFSSIPTQWRLVALKVPEARTHCPTIIVFTTPVRFSERDTHLVLWLTYKETRIWFRFRRKKKRFPKMTGEARPQLPHMTSRHCSDNSAWHERLTQGTRPSTNPDRPKPDSMYHIRIASSRLTGLPTAHWSSQHPGRVCNQPRWLSFIPCGGFAEATTRYWATLGRGYPLLWPDTTFQRRLKCHAKCPSRGRRHLNTSTLTPNKTKSLIPNWPRLLITWSISENRDQYLYRIDGQIKISRFKVTENLWVLHKSKPLTRSGHFTSPWCCPKFWAKFWRSAWKWC